MQDGTGKLSKLTLVVWVSLLANAQAAHAQPVPQTVQIQEGTPTLPPLGYLNFCERHADQCAQQGNSEPPTTNQSTANFYGDRSALASAASSARAYPRFNWRAVFINTTQTSSQLGASDYPAAINIQSNL